MKTKQAMYFTFLTAALAALLSTAVQAQEAIGQNDQLIHDAARLGKGEDVSRILKANPAMRDARNDVGSTPLHLAATNPDSGPVKVLLAAGANVNALDNDSNTPLHMAAYVNRTENAQLLLEAGADTSVVNSGGRTAIALGRKSRGDEAAGVIALWDLKGCQAGKHCKQPVPFDLQKMVDQ